MKSIDISVLACVAAALMACAPAPVDTASDRASLLALHEQAMEAHRKSDVELLLQADDADLVLASRGEISRPSLERRRQFLGSYLRGVRFTEYIDVVAPVVHVSAEAASGGAWATSRISNDHSHLGGARLEKKRRQAYV